MLNRRVRRGFTLIEMMIALAIASGLLMMALPGFGRMLNNYQIRVASESLQTGLQLARAEAVRRNAAIRFQLTSTADNACGLSAAGRNWVISRDNPAGACASAPSDTVAPRIIQSRAASEGGGGVTVAAFLMGTPTSGQSVAIFNGLGQLTAPAAGMSIRLTHPTAGSCKGQGGELRCLQVNVSRSGQVRMCDPFRSGSDPEAC